MATTTEAECCTLLYNAKELKALRNALKEMGHTQPIT